MNINDFASYRILIVILFLYFYEAYCMRPRQYMTVGFIILAINVCYMSWIIMAILTGFSLGIGGYLYLVSFILFWYSFFSSSKEFVNGSSKNKTLKNKKMIDNPITIEGCYVLGYYVSGLPVNVKPKNAAVMMFDRDKDNVGIYVYSKTTERIHIKLKNLVSIEVEDTNPPKRVKTYKDEEKMTIYSALLNYFGAFIGSDELLIKIDEHAKHLEENSYIISIGYTEEKEKRYIAINTNENPEDFITSILEMKEKIHK